MYRVLIIDDNKLLLESLEMFLSSSGYEVVTTPSAVEGLLKCSNEKWDLVLVDYYMDEMSGGSFLELVNKLDKEVKIVIFTADASEEIELEVLSKNAVDFIHKSENPEILLKRLERILEGEKRNNVKLNSPNEEVEMDVDYRIVTVKGNVIELSNTEFDILKVLLENQNRVLSRDFIHDQVWTSKNKYLAETRAIDVHVLNLRRKLDVDCIVTRKGFGYVWSDS